MPQATSLSPTSQSQRPQVTPDGIVSTSAGKGPSLGFTEMAARPHPPGSPNPPKFAADAAGNSFSSIPTTWRVRRSPRPGHYLHRRRHMVHRLQQ